MGFRKSSNPAISDRVFKRVSHEAELAERMTINGTANKAGIMLLIVILSASLTWGMAFRGQNISFLIGFGVIGGLITALVTIIGKPQWAPITGPVYAVLEGLALGGISAYYESMLPGILTTAVGLTFAVFFFMLFAYKSKLIKPTQKFKSIIITSIGGILVFYIVRIVLGLFGIELAFLAGGLLGIGIQLFIVAIAALSLILDFGSIEENAAMGAPKFMEWYSAFGLMITLVWLYLEILRLVAMFSGND